MILASRGIDPPKEWMHDPNLMSNSMNTVAMIIAYKGLIPPKRWRHFPNV